MRFRRWVVFTFLVHVLVVLVDKGAGFVLFKLLEDSPEVKGAVDMLAVVPFLIMSIGNLGLATSSVYYLRRGEFGLQDVARTNALVALVWGSVVAVLAVVGSQTIGPWLRPEWNFDLSYVLPVCLSVPLLLTASYFNSIQLATERVRDYNLAHLVASAAFLPLFLVFYFACSGDAVSGIVLGRLATAVLVCGLVLWMLRGVVRWRPKMHWPFFRAGIAYGWKANLTSILTYLNHRVDLFLVGFMFLGTAGLSGEPLKKAQLAQVAYYSLAVSWAEMVWHFPEALRDLFFSKVAGSTHEQAKRFTPVLCRLALWAALAGSVAIWVLVDPFMMLISPEKWGPLWSGSVTGALQVLLPGTAAYTVAKVLQQDLAARGHLNHTMAASTLVLVVMIALDVLWIPAYGAYGAAAASTVAYVVSALYTLIAYRLCGGGAIGQCLLLRPSDAGYVRELAVAIRDKIRRKRS